MSKRGQVKPSVDAGGPDGDYTTKVSWRIESGKRIIEKVERIAPTPPTADETPAPTTAYVTCPDCKAIHQLGKCREQAVTSEGQGARQHDLEIMLGYALEGRCPCCGWPLKASANEGCIIDNCSMRPERSPFASTWLRRAKIVREMRLLHATPPPADAPPFGSQVEDFAGLSEAEVKVAMGIAPPPAMNLQERLLEVAREFLYPNNCWPTGYSDWVNKEVNKLVALLLAERGKAQGEHEELKPAQPSETLPAGANILDEVSLLVSAVREFEQHSYVAGDPVGGCGECLRLFDRLIAQANTIEIAMRTKSRASRRDL